MNMGNKKGQAILFAIVGVTIALAIGVTVASRNLSSISRVTRSDSAARAYAAAEGGIERLLALSDAVLTSLVVDTSGEQCEPAGFSKSVREGGFCSIIYTPTAGDMAGSMADVKVENFSANEGEFYAFSIPSGYTKEVNMEGYSTNDSPRVNICWSRDGVEPSAIAYLSYDANGNVSRNSLVPSGEYSGDISDYGFTSVDRRTPSATNPYYYCSEVTLVKNPYGLRIQPLFKDEDIGVSAVGESSLPNQGFKFISIGSVNEQSEVKSKAVTVFRSLPYMPGFFDYSIFSAALP